MQQIPTLPRKGSRSRTRAPCRSGQHARDAARAQRARPVRPGDPRRPRLGIADRVTLTSGRLTGAPIATAGRSTLMSTSMSRPTATTARRSPSSRASPPPTSDPTSGCSTPGRSSARSRRRWSSAPRARSASRRGRPLRDGRDVRGRRAGGLGAARSAARLALARLHQADRPAGRAPAPAQPSGPGGSCGRRHGGGADDGLHQREQPERAADVVLLDRPAGEWRGAHAGSTRAPAGRISAVASRGDGGGRRTADRDARAGGRRRPAAARAAARGARLGRAVAGVPAAAARRRPGGGSSPSRASATAAASRRPRRGRRASSTRRRSRSCPRCCSQLDAAEPILVGHSDGASIGPIHAAHHPVTRPGRCSRRTCSSRT